MLKRLIILILIAFSVGSSLMAQLRGEIYFASDSGKKVINLGPCYVGSSVFASFVIRNTGTATLRMLGVSPSLELYASPFALTNFEYLRFSPHSPSLPFNLTYGERMQDTLTIRYQAELDTVAGPLGRKEAMLKIGLVNPLDTTQLIVQDSFRLIARKTIRFVEGFTDEIHFDSVIVNSSQKINSFYSVRNTQNTILPIISSKDSLLSQQGSFKEFFFEEKIFPISILPKTSKLDWEIEYKPRDSGTDTSLFKVFFVPNPIEKPDSTSFCFVKTIGTGVVQSLIINDANAVFSNDTVLLGNVPIKSGKSLEIKLKNNGSMPIGATSQRFEEVLSGLTPTGFTFSKPLLSNSGHLAIGGEDKVIINIQPQSRGLFTIKYIIETDVSLRKIRGVQETDRQLVFYITGRAVEPEISIISDTIDFGTVVYSGDIYGDCPSRKDTILRVLNIGNIDLSVSDILLDDDFYFSVSEKEMLIAGNNEKSLLLSFNSGFPPAQHISKMKIISNSTFPKDSLTIWLKAQSVPPVLAELALPNDLSAKPGNLLDVPLILTNEFYSPSLYAKFYELELNFNPTLLKFDSRNTINTASEGASFAVREISPGHLKINVSSSDFLLPLDTLIKLRFKAYLGDAISTELAIANALFGSGNCKRVIDTRILNGKFSIDSVCGLQYKILPTDFRAAMIHSISPNPASNLVSIEYQTTFKSDVKISIYNSFGIELISLKQGNLEKGIHSAIIPIDELPAGAYFVRLCTDEITNTKPIVVSK